MTDQTTTTAPPQAWHRLTSGSIDAFLVFQDRIGADAAAVLNPVLRDNPAVAQAVRTALDAHFDVAFQAGRDSRGPITDADRLWAVHVQGSDDIVAHPDRAAAERFVTWANARDAENDANPHYATGPDGKPVQTDVYLRAYVVEWPFTPDAHAEDLREQDEASS